MEEVQVEHPITRPIVPVATTKRTAFLCGVVSPEVIAVVILSSRAVFRQQGHRLQIQLRRGAQAGCGSGSKEGGTAAVALG